MVIISPTNHNLQSFLINKKLSPNKFNCHAKISVARKGNKMKKYTSPRLTCVCMDTEDIMITSGDTLDLDNASENSHGTMAWPF